MLDSVSQITFNPSAHSKITVPRQFIGKVTLSKQRYAELDFFRQQIEEARAGLHHKPFTSNRRSVFLYQVTFFVFAFFFCLLGITVLSIPSALGCGFFSSCTAIKGVLASLCTIFALASFTIAFSISQEKEAVLQCVRKAKTTLDTVYSRKRIRLGIKSFAGVFIRQRQKGIALKHLYQEANDKINDKKDAVLHLIHRISTAETIDFIEKETLLNQAIEELNEKLQHIVYTFRHSS